MSNELKDIERFKNAPIGTSDHNKWLVTEYPWLFPRNVWTDEKVKDYDYEFTLLDEMPVGWHLRFGLQMCEEINNLLKEVDYVDKYRILQIKEKYGSLRWYSGRVPESISARHEEIIEKYTNLSMYTCIICGAPATVVTTGWIEPFCSDCVNGYDLNYKEINEFYRGW